MYKRHLGHIGTYTSVNGVPGKSEGIYAMELDTDTGSLLLAGDPVKVDNPSYLAIDSDRHLLYSVVETDEYNGVLGGAVAAFSIDIVNYCAAIHLSPDGKHLYASNRGHDSLAIFKTDPLTGRLEAVAHAPSCGAWPRDFEIDPTGRFLFIANQESNSIISYLINKETGMLEKLGYTIHIPNPVCIKFLK